MQMLCVPKCHAVSTRCVLITLVLHTYMHPTHSHSFYTLLFHSIGLAAEGTDSAQLSQQSGPIVPSQSSGLAPPLPLGDTSAPADLAHIKKLRHTRGASITRADVSGTSGSRPSSAKASVSMSTQTKTSVGGRESPQRSSQTVENRSQAERAVSPTGVKLSGSFSRDVSNEGAGGVGGSVGEDGYGDVKHPEKSSEHQLSIIHQKAAGMEASGGVPPGGGATSPSSFAGAHATGSESKPPAGKLPKQTSVDSAGTHGQQRQVDVPVLHQKHLSMDTSGFHIKQTSMDTTSTHQRQAAVLDSVSHQKQMSMDAAVGVASAVGVAAHQKQASADGGSSQQKQGVGDAEGLGMVQPPKQLSMDSASAAMKQENHDVEFLRQSSADTASPSVTMVSPFRSPKLSRRAPIPILISSNSEAGGPDQRSPLVSRQTLVRARSTQALDKAQQCEDKGVKHRSYTFTGDTKEIGAVAVDMTLMSEGNGDDTLVSSEEDSMLVVTSSPSVPPAPAEELDPGTNQMGLGAEHGGSGSATPVRPFSVRTSSAGLRKDLSDSSISSRIRPRSMIETSCGMSHSREVKATPPDVLAQLFWTSCSLLESDYEDEFILALKLFSKVRVCDLCRWLRSCEVYAVYM